MFAMSSKYKCSYHWHHLYLLHTALSQFTYSFSFPLDLVVTDILNLKVHVLLCGVKIRSDFQRASQGGTHTHTHTQTHIYVHMHTQLRNLPLEFFLGINLDQYANIYSKNLYYIIFCNNKNLRTYN